MAQRGDPASALRLPSLVELTQQSRARVDRQRRRDAAATYEDAEITVSTRSLGGKGARLVWLSRHGFEVPDARVLPAEVFEAVARDVLPPGHDVRSLLRLSGTREGLERAGRAYAALRDATLPAWLAEEVERAWDALRPHATWGLAVRSSATCEDSSSSSLAGLASTVLGARGGPAVADAIREVWASLVLPRALAYLASRGISHGAMAVVLQVLVEAKSSGVATCTLKRAPILEAPPIARRGRRSKEPPAPIAPEHIALDVNSTWGLGAPLVAGVASPDVLRVEIDQGFAMATGEGADAGVRIVDRTTAHKPFALVGSREPHASGTHQVAVAPYERDLPALDEVDVRALAEVSTTLLKLGRGPWEIEFATRRDRPGVLSLLQARPVIETGLPNGGDESTVWSCANLAEALPGVATPLTWAVASNFSELGFRRAFSALGASVPRGTTLLGNVHGRFYLNLSAFMRVAATVPGLEPSTLIELGGGDGAQALQSQLGEVSHRGFYARLPLIAARWIREQAALDGDLHRFEQDATRQREAFQALDLGILTDDGVATMLHDLQRFLDRTGGLMLTCASSALGAFVALRAVVARAMPVGATRIAEDLTSGGALRGYGELESARPTVSLVRIVEITLHDPPALARFSELPTPRTLEELPLGPTRTALTRWLEAYGDRCVREAELSTPRWREDPTLPLQTLTMYLARARQGLPYAPPMAEVSARADEALARIEGKLSLLERTALRHLIARCQRFSRLRERMRAWVTWVLSAIRRGALEGERRLHRHLPSLRQGDVWFCTLDELLAVLRGEARSIERIVTLRRAEHARDLARPDPPVTFTGRPPTVRLEALGGPVLRGHGASPGVVKGPVRVLSSPDEAASLQPGDVLVTRTTDVGWTPLFVAVAGIVTELGGPLSHAAIVARELGVPCVVNVQGAIARLRDGDRVRLDGDRGLVELIVAEDATGTTEATEDASHDARQVAHEPEVAT